MRTYRKLGVIALVALTTVLTGCGEGGHGSEIAAPAQTVTATVTATATATLTPT